MFILIIFIFIFTFKGEKIFITIELTNLELEFRLEKYVQFRM